MADAKHTPGPWVLKRDGVIVGGEVTMLPRGAVQQQVASACVVREENGDREANARLIAAAPELLAALIAVLPSALVMINENHAGMKLARAAIAKATGSAS